MNEKQKAPAGNTDEREKARPLSEAEKKRLAHFEALSADLAARGYRKTELTVGIVRANIFAVVLLIPLAAVGLLAFWLKHRSLALGFTSASSMLCMLAFLVLIAVHELIHGAGWALFTPRGFQDIEFGFMKQYLTPYCACLVPLKKGPYVFGALMPLVLLGLLPMAAAVLLGSMPLLILGIMMADAAAGDIMIAWNVLRYHSDAGDVKYLDHPTQAGGVIFEK